MARRVIRWFAAGTPLRLRFGEDATVPGAPGYKASAELDQMIGRLLPQA